jgi:hypothetical protein
MPTNLIAKETTDSFAPSAVNIAPSATKQHSYQTTPSVSDNNVTINDRVYWSRWDLSSSPHACEACIATILNYQPLISIFPFSYSLI